MTAKNRQQLLGVLAIAGLVLLGGERLVLNPLAANWKARAERVHKMRTSVIQGTTLLGDEAKIRARWDSMRTNTLVQEVSAAESQMLRAFDRWSQDSGVSISIIRPQWTPGADEYATLECRADVSGNLSSLTRFLYLLEQDPLALKVQGVELATRDNQGQQLTLGLQVSGLQLSLTP